MNILLVAERYWPEVGAAPSRLANMAEGLKQKGCKVDVLTSLPNYPMGRIFKEYRRRVTKHETRNGVNLFRYWIYATVSQSPIARIANMFSFAFTMWLFAFKRKRIKAYDAVIIQTPTLVAAASAMKLFKCLYGKKSILNVSDIWPLTAIDMGAMKEGSRSFRFMAKLEHFLYCKADAVLGQSEEILNHVAQEMTEQAFREEKDTENILGSKLWKMNEKLFLYRNLQRYQPHYDHKSRHGTLKLAFSGMLGVAQDVAGIVKNIPFKELDIEFHIFGGGKQLEEIKNWCAANPDSKVFAHGFVPKEEIAERLKEMDASVVPLASRIRGAVPSKIFDILPQGLPILFCGGGEGARFIQEHEVGMTSTPGDYEALQANMIKLRDMEEKTYEAMSARCIQVSQEELDFDKQMSKVVEMLDRNLQI